MLNDVTSRHLRNANDLLVLIPIKQGFVPIDETLSYATRLRVLLRTLYEGRRLLAESKAGWSAGPTEKLETILNSQYTVLPDNRHLLLTVTFDRNWDEYFQFLVLHSGPTLDAIFMHCEGYADHACRKYHADGTVTLQYQAFAEFVRRHQLPCEFYYAAFPDLTSDDIVYLRKLAAERNPSAARVATIKIGKAKHEIAELVKKTTQEKYPHLTTKEDVHDFLAEERKANVRRSLTGLFDLRSRFPELVEPDEKSASALARASDYFDAAVINFVPDLAGVQLERTHGPIDAWIAELKGKVNPRRTTAVPSTTLDLSNIQANILTGYDKTQAGCAVLLHWEDRTAAVKFLKEMQSRLWPDQSPCQNTGVFFNLSITLRGFKRLDLPDEVLGQFPKDFRDGMEQRCGALGDVGEPNHPDYWQLPVANWVQGESEGKGTLDESRSDRIALTAVDCVVLLQTPTAWNDPSLAWETHPLRARVQELEGNGTRILHVQQLRRQGRGEHFGFSEDGVSQPVPNLEPFTQPGTCRRDLTPLGEFLLGHADARGEIARCADAQHNAKSHELFMNGSFLVVRKLEQDVAAFNAFAKKRGDDLGVDACQFKAWMMGRTLEGSPLVDTRAPGNNDFDYDDDPVGMKCPLHAHIRRANPRSTEPDQGPVPRIMRRSFSYESRRPPAKERTATQSNEKGLLFMAYNASIAQQFEVIQRWLNGGNSTGILSAQNDLFSGVPQPTSVPHWAHDCKREKWVDMQSPTQPFVSLRWGLYLFAPAKTALQWLTRDVAAVAPTADRALIRKGEGIIAGLQAVESQQGARAARIAWKSLIEESVNESASAAAWAAIRARCKGTLMTAYGLLVANEAGAQEVLAGDGRTFSVREYWHRLQATTGEHYLSFDPSGRALRGDSPEEQQKHAKYEARMGQPGGNYAAAATLPNQYIEDNLNNAEQAFRTAYTLAQSALESWGDDEVRVKDFATVVVARLSRAWFGFPALCSGSSKEDEIAALEPFVLASRFAFQPYPETTLTQHARARGTEIREIDDYRRLKGGQFWQHLTRTGGFSDEAAARALAGAVVGFAAPAIAAIALLLNHWMEDNELGRIAESVRSSSPSREAMKTIGVLREPVLQALYRTPVPPLLYRTAMPGAKVAGAPVEPGTMVIVSLASVRADSVDRDNAWNWLFGGERNKPNPHGCPARNGALGTVMGVVAALLEHPRVRKARPLVLTYS